MTATEAIEIARKHLNAAGYEYFRAKSSKKIPNQNTFEVIADVGTINYIWMRVLIAESGDVLEQEQLE